MPLDERVYTGRDNTIELALSVDDVTIDHTAITRVQLIVGSTTLDSQTSSVFDFTAQDRLVLGLGAAGLPDGVWSAQLVIYDLDHPNGRVWDTLKLIVHGS